MLKGLNLVFFALNFIVGVASLIVGDYGWAAACLLISSLNLFAATYENSN